MYNNFVKPSFHLDCTALQSENSTYKYVRLSGEEANKIYRDVVKSAISYDFNTSDHKTDASKSLTVNRTSCDISDKDLFLCVQDNDVNKLKLVLDRCPEKIHIVDDYGWSLLMIACQANSIEVVEELMRRKIDVNIRDKAGNSAQSLIIKNKNYTLAKILLNDINKQKEAKINSIICKTNVVTDFFCEICNMKITENKNSHLSSTAHNINLSKDKKVPTNYLIPESNKGYQIMLKGGWNKESGLGPDGSGIKYPIKTKKKEDRKGLGHRKCTREVQKEVKHSKSKLKSKLYHEDKRKMEIYFRRQFY